MIKKTILLMAASVGLTTMTVLAQDSTLYRSSSPTYDQYTNRTEDSTRTLFRCDKDKSGYRKKRSFIGFYGEMDYQYGQIRDEFTSFSGGSFMVIFNKKFAIGATMQRNIDQNFAPDFVDPFYLHAGFGGFKMEYTCMPRSVVHFTFPLVIGKGWANANASRHIYSDDFYEDHPATNKFYIIQPGAQVELNITRLLKFYTGVNYRFSFEADITNTFASHTLQGFSGVAGLKLGIYDMVIRRR